MEPHRISRLYCLQDARNGASDALRSSIYVDLSTRNIEDSSPDHRFESYHGLRTFCPKGSGILRSRIKIILK